MPKMQAHRCRRPVRICDSQAARAPNSAIVIWSQELARVYDLKHATKIDTVAAALRAMGYELQLQVSPAT